MERKRVKILDVLIDAINMDQAIQRISEWIDTKRKSYVCVAPVATVVSALDDDKYLEVLNHADMVTPDGMPIVWVGRAKGYREMGRVCGPDMMKKICIDPCLSHCRHFFFGATDQTLHELQEQLRKWNPDIKICGAIAPPFRDKAQVEDDDVVGRINHAQPDILWVGIGAPKQDYWMALNRDRIDAPVLVGIGAAFDFLAGNKPRAPKWMQKIGMEWFFRLCCEPRRLWRRYVIGNTRFCFEFLKEVLGLRK